ncbi:MAG: hypothetical protein KKA19_04960 [Candidatus Margulisbacteria bacterium]|nr:hypothetical protein [Candidatus Margulisiibacteriota bacterium]
MEEKLDLILKQLKKLDSLETELKEFKEHITKEIHTGFCKTEEEIKELSEQSTKNRDKILSAVDEFAFRVTKNEEEILSLSHRQREHEDKIEALEEQVS